MQFYLVEGGWRRRGLLLASIAAHHDQLKYAKLLAPQESIEPPDDAKA